MVAAAAAVVVVMVAVVAAMVAVVVVALCPLRDESLGVDAFFPQQARGGKGKRRDGRQENGRFDQECFMLTLDFGGAGRGGGGWDKRNPDDSTQLDPE